MSESKYLLNRDAKESARLIDQHEWLKDLTSCIVHPTIPLPNSKTASDSSTTTYTKDKPLRIADVATGTAIFLLDLASSLPAETTQFYGFDISAAQFPPADQRPANVSLHEHNCTKEFPAEYHGTFDVVAVRLITAGLRGDDWDKAVKNVSQLLKPGGYLQWIEPVHSSMQVFTSKPGAPNAATRRAVEFFLDGYKKTLYPGPLRLPELLDALSGPDSLEDIALEVYPTDHYRDLEKVRSQGKAFLSGAIGAMMSYIAKDGLSEEEVKQVVEKSMQELDGDLFLRSEMQFIVRRKKAAA